jgi:hypothetical protein
MGMFPSGVILGGNYFESTGGSLAQFVTAISKRQRESMLES